MVKGKTDGINGDGGDMTQTDIDGTAQCSDTQLQRVCDRIQSYFPNSSPGHTNNKDITAIDMKPPIKDAKEIQNTVSTDDTEILDKGGGGKDRSEKNKLQM